MGFTVRPASWEDIPLIAELAQQEHFNDGIEGFELAFKQSHDGWFVIFDDETGQLVCYQLVNHVLRGVDVGYQILTRDGYKGRGLTNLLPNSLKVSDKRDCFGGYAAADSLRKLIKGFPIEFKWAMTEYGGTVKPEILRKVPLLKTPGIDVVPYSDDLLPRLLSMDKEIAAMDRSKFMSGFWRAKSAFTRVAVDASGRVRGSVTFWRVSDDELFGHAMYADSEQVAASLITRILHDAGELSFSIFSMNVVSDKSSVQRVFTKLGFERLGRYVLWRNIPSPDYYSTIDVSRLYCPHMYWAV